MPAIIGRGGRGFRSIRISICLCAGLWLAAAWLAGLPVWGQEGDRAPLLPEGVVHALAAELSGTTAKHTLQELTLYHRMRGSRAFAAAADRIRRGAIEAGLDGVEVLRLPADGQRFYGTQRSRPAWDAEFAELWEQRPPARLAAGREAAGADRAGKALQQAAAARDAWVDALRIASWDERPVTLAQDSASGEVAAALVDCGDGTAERDYAGKEVRGRLVLVAAQPVAAYALAVERFGAAGIISYAQNQQTAWWKEDENLVRWGHLPTFPAPTTFAFMVSLKQARAWKERLGRGETVRLHASVRAGQHPGSYDIVTATLAGRDPTLRGEEIVLSCHLDHQRPGANDNASGCATILEVGRTLAKLAREGKIAPPRRTLRFVWPPEIEGSIALLNAHPELAAKARAVIHLDMVGGDAAITKAVFHITRSPRSLPTFANDVAEAFGRFVNAQSYAYAATGTADLPLVDGEGSKIALQAEVSDFTAGSDHEVWTEGSFRVPAIYLNDWPDRFIHTNADTVANIDSSKLLRAAFIAAASALYLADLGPADASSLRAVVHQHALERTAGYLARRERLRAEGEPEAEAANLLRFHLSYEAGVLASLRGFLGHDAAAAPGADAAAAGGGDESFLAGLARLCAGEPSGAVAPRAAPREAKAPEPPVSAADARVFRRNPDPKGPLSGFGYDYLEDHLERAHLSKPALLSYAGLWGGGADAAYEALNLVDGQRTVQQVRDDLAAIYGPVPLQLVSDYLTALERIGLLARVGAPAAPANRHEPSPGGHPR